MAGNKNSGNRYNSPYARNKMDAVDPETNSRSINFVMALSKLPDIDHSSVDETIERIELFFQMCDEHGVRPLIGSLAIALGITKDVLYRITTGRSQGVTHGFTPATISEIKKALNFLEGVFELDMIDSKAPVASIFYAKSNLGWREAPNETVITHRSDEKRLSGATADEVASKYAQLVGVEDIPEAETYELPAGDDK